MSASSVPPASLRQLTLITGATSGIGLHLAREFARQGHPVVLVAPVQRELDTITSGLRAEFSVEAHGIAADLRDPDAADRIFIQLTALGLAPGILINNAGLGRSGKFWEIPLEDDISMIRLNIEAVIRLTKRFLPTVLVSGGRLLITASVAGFEPGPRMAVYHATKAFVLSWSEALATELEGTHVSITALCPGPVDTDFFPKADLIDSSAFQRAQVMAPQEVATAAYEALMEGDRIVVPGVANKALVFARRFLPEAGQAKINEKLYSPTKPSKRKRERGDEERKASAEQNAA
jgi:uncharacterized protein